MFQCRRNVRRRDFWLFVLLRSNYVKINYEVFWYIFIIENIFFAKIFLLVVGTKLFYGRTYLGQVFTRAVEL